MLTHRSSLSARRGYAMGLFLVILSVLTTTVVMLLNTSAEESKNTYRQQQMTAAKLAGLSAIDSFYARLQTVPDFPASTSPASLRTDVNPSDANPDWFRVVDGNVTLCGQDENQPCYQLATQLDTGQRTPIIEVTAKVRYNCRGGDCSHLYLTQRLRAWQFTDFLFYTQYNVISPGFTDFYKSKAYFSWRDPNLADPCATNWAQRVAKGLGDNQCPVIAYTAFDRVDGPVYSADDFIAVCGNPESIFVNPSASRKVWSLPSDNGSPVRSAGDPAIRGDSACTSFSTPYGQAATFPLRLPPARTTFDQAKASAPADRNLPGGSTLTFSGRDVTWNSGGTNGVLHLVEGQIFTVDGDATITGGTFEGRASLFVRGRVTIEGSLTYTTPIRDGAGNPAGSVLGINAGKDIVLQSAPQSCTSPNPTKFELDAILISLGGTVFADSMQSLLPSGRCAQALVLRGAVATKYQGVYGLYDAATGQALAGFRKEFTHDSRAAEDMKFLPPSLVTPSGLQWIRLDLAEVYCDTSATTCQ